MRQSMKYKVSTNISISGVNDYFKVAVPEQYQNGFYVLRDQKADTYFLINDTIQYFIGKFSIPKKKSTVLKEIQAEIKSEASSFKDAYNTFFKHLKNKKILVPGEKEEKAIETESLFKEDAAIDNFKVLKVLSDKKTTEIYLAQENVSNEKYILKLINRRKTNDLQVFKKEVGFLKKEYKALHKIKGIESISKVHGFNKKNKLYAYIVLEYIEGKSLSAYLNDGALVTREDCLYLIEEIIYAFSLLHKRKMVHGDIHSSNILIDENGSVKIIDVGMSRNLRSEKHQVLKFGGINHYMPPERINITSSNKFTSEPDLYSDVYQVGLLVYLVLYNVLPFSGFIWEELATNIKKQKIEYNQLSFLHYEVPSALTAIVKKCLNKNPLKRYANAGAISKAFKLMKIKEY